MKTKLILSVLFSLIVAIFSGVGISMIFEASPMLFVVGIFALSFLPFLQSKGYAFAGVFREIWTGEVVKELTTAEIATFLDGITDYSKYVANVGDEMQVIHLVYMGVLPDVLVNNVTYPIPIQELGQDDIPISLHKFQTKATPVTDDELYALSYDKIAVVKGKHAKAIIIVKNKMAIHALAPTGATAKMPIILTTGGNDGTGRRRLVWEDIVRLKSECDDLEIPEIDRRLVLSTEHANDLLLLDQKFKDQFYNAQSGKPYSQCGFDFFQYVANPYYTVATKAKLAFGAIPGAGTRRATVMFSKERAAKANGWTKMYFSEAKTDTQNQRNLVNFRHNAIVLPTQEDGRGAILSADFE
jgi:hypothetical protein